MDGFQNESMYWSSPPSIQQQAAIPQLEQLHNQLKQNGMPDVETAVSPSKETRDLQIRVPDPINGIQPTRTAQNEIGPVPEMQVTGVRGVSDVSAADSFCQIQQTLEPAVGSMDGSTVSYGVDSSVNLMPGESAGEPQSIYAGYSGSAAFCVEPAADEELQNRTRHLADAASIDEFCAGPLSEPGVSLDADDCRDSASACQYEQNRGSGVYQQPNLAPISETPRSELSAPAAHGGQPYRRHGSRKLGGYGHLRGQGAGPHEPCSSGYESSSAHGSSPYTSPESMNGCDNPMGECSLLFCAPELVWLDANHCLSMTGLGSRSAPDECCFCLGVHGVSTAMVIFASPKSLFMIPNLPAFILSFFKSPLCFRATKYPMYLDRRHIFE